MEKRLSIALALSFIFSMPGILAAQNKLEPWYTYWGLGYSDVSYPQELDDTFNAVSDMPGVGHVSMSMDLLGFYWPSGEKTIMGAVVNAWGDRYEIDNEHIQVNGYLVSFSLMQFLNTADKIGKGPFFRADFGAARLSVDTSFMNDINSEWGYGGLVGGGVGIPVSAGTRILLNVNYSFRKVEQNSYGSFQISVGGLF